MPNSVKPGKNTVIQLLGWFDHAGRKLPWRSKPPRDPYHVWLSEIMLQQTTVAAVIPYYEKFLSLYPDVHVLANADRDEVLANWAGLGYYARARNLHKCAKEVVAKHAGCFPNNVEELKTLSGIGTYTAAAIAAIAFGQSATVVDGNIERIISRLFAVKDPLPKSRKQLYGLATKLTPAQRPGDYAEALMDLGATVCTPKGPDCGVCPINENCMANQRGLQSELPRRLAKAEKPIRRGVVFWLEDKGQILVQRRPDEGLLGGMLEFPSTPWREDKMNVEQAISHAPLKADWKPVPGEISHTFTHFHLKLQVLRGATNAKGHNGQWLSEHELMSAGFPTVMKKVARHVLYESGS